MRGAYFAILSQALAAALAIFIVGQQGTTGGTNGITNLKNFFGYNLDDPVNRRMVYFIIAGVLLGVIAITRQLMFSRYGELLVATRDAYQRVRFLGYNPARVLTAAFAVSAAMAGLGGAAFVSIVGLVLVLKVLFYWLNAKAYASMAKMKAINPKIMEMRERLKDKPQQMQQEMMRIYREEKVNPMGGCLPIIIQIPVFIALYWVLLSSVEMRNAPWIGWITDLSSPDPFFILPVLMTLSSLLQTALNPAPPDPMQAKMMWIMPLMFSVMFFFFPAGLVLYWLTNNILSIAQQWLINTRMGVPPQFNLPKFK